VDTIGNIFIADQGNCIIRKIDVNAIVTTFAGSYYGHLDGLATYAQLMYPYDIAVGSSGYYVPTLYDHRIRLISTAGYVSSFAGSGTVGDVDGAAPSAQFNTPYGVAVASDGTVFVTDYYNSKIRKISGGVVSTYAGNGYTGSADGSLAVAQFTNPFKIAVDLHNNIYVTEKSGNAIRMISSSGIVSTLFTSITPGGIACDSSGNVFTVNGFKIVKLTSSGNTMTMSTWAGSSSSGTANGLSTFASFSNLVGVAIGLTNLIYVTDTNVIRSILEIK